MVHLDEGDPAGAGVALQVADGDLAVMFQVSLLTEDVMDAGHHFVPLVVIAKPAEKKKKEIQIFPLFFSVTLKLHIIFSCIFFFFYLFRTTLTIPVGRISRDLPQNLFFHRWSVQFKIKELMLRN